MKLSVTFLFLICLFNIGCSDSNEDQIFGFGVSNTTKYETLNVIVTFVGHGGTWPIGDVGELKTVDLIDGPVPDAADLTWTDGAGKVHKQHMQIRPMPPPTQHSHNGRVRNIYFVLQTDETFKMVYHDPGYKE